jgi:hypothetical protein
MRGGILPCTPRALYAYVVLLDRYLLRQQLKTSGAAAGLTLNQGELD